VLPATGSPYNESVEQAAMSARALASERLTLPRFSDPLRQCATRREPDHGRSRPRCRINGSRKPVKRFVQPQQEPAGTATVPFEESAFLQAVVDAIPGTFCVKRSGRNRLSREGESSVA